MTWFKRNAGARVELVARAESEDGRTVADARIVIGPRDTFAGLNYPEWRLMADGPVRIEFFGGNAVSAVSLAKVGRRP